MYNFEEANAAFEEMEATIQAARTKYHAKMKSLGWTINSYGSYEDRFSQFEPKEYNGGFDHWGVPNEKVRNWSTLPT